MDVRLDLVRLGVRIHPEAWAVIDRRRSLPPPDGDWPRPPKWWGPWPPPNAHWHEHSLAPLLDPRSWDRHAQLEIVGLTRRISDAAASVHAQGGDAVSFIGSVLDDGWGIEGRPPELVLPKAWWHDIVPPPDEPRPIAPDLNAVFAAAGVSFMTLGAQIGIASLSEALGEAGRRSLDIASRGA